MSVKQLESAISALPPNERREIINWLDDHRHELIAPVDEISPEVRAELELRLKEMDEHPELLEPFEEGDLDRMIRKAVDAHAKKPPARQR